MSDTGIKAQDEKFCAECGSIIKAKAVICPKCGCGMRASNNNSLGQTAPNGKSRIAAVLLAFFLGGLGVHKFYLGETTLGILYLLFCWTLIPGLIAFIEAILLLVMSDDDFNQKYGSV